MSKFLKKYQKNDDDLFFRYWKTCNLGVEKNRSVQFGVYSKLDTFWSKMSKSLSAKFQKIKLKKFKILIKFPKY